MALRWVSSATSNTLAVDRRKPAVAQVEREHRLSKPGVTAATAHTRNAERLSLDQLAHELDVYERTLRAAARTSRLQVPEGT